MKKSSNRKKEINSVRKINFKGVKLVDNKKAQQKSVD